MHKPPLTLPHTYHYHHPTTTTTPPLPPLSPPPPTTKHHDHVQGSFRGVEFRVNHPTPPQPTPPTLSTLTRTAGPSRR